MAIYRTSKIVICAALALGLVIGPLFAYQNVKLDLMWTGIVAGSAAYGIDRLRRALR